MVELVRSGGMIDLEIGLAISPAGVLSSFYGRWE